MMKKKEKKTRRPRGLLRRQRLYDNGNLELVAGGLLGLFVIAGLIFGFTICYTCIIASPILLGYGWYKRRKVRG